MRIRFGFVAMSLKLADSSPSKTITATNFQKLKDQDVKLHRLNKIAKENLLNSLRILRHAVAHGIYVYRFTSKLIPLATHPATDFWPWQEQLQDEFIQLGNFIRENNIRVSAHPDHFTILNSPKEDVFTNALADLIYHHQIFESMNVDKQGKLVIHLGGAYKDKEKSVQRFQANFVKLPSFIKKRLTLENDDKSFHAEDILHVCQQLGIPMVFDLHHHQCNPSKTPIIDLLPHIFETWRGTHLVPKIHLSSPKSPKDFRSHAPDIEPTYFCQFLETAKQLNIDFDVMIEAKNKDLALFNLMAYLKKIDNVIFETEAIISF